MVKKNMTMLLKTILIGVGLSLSPGVWDVLAAPVQIGTPSDFKSCTRVGPGWWECRDNGKMYWCPQKNSPKKNCTDRGIRSTVEPMAKPPRGKAPMQGPVEKLKKP